MSQEMQSSEQSVQGEPQGSATDYLADLQGKVSEIDSERVELKGAVERSNRTLERIQSAFKDESSDEAEDDDSKDQKLLDMFLDAALEDQKSGGKGMPLTTKLAMETVGLKKMLREIRSEMSRLGETQKMALSPEYKYDNDAFSQIDSQVQTAIKGIYNEVDPYLFEAVSKDIGKEIQRLKKESPSTWEEIRRNPEYIRRMSLHFVEKKIPPKAREMLRVEQEKATPMTLQEMRQAFKEADQIKDIKSRNEIKTAIRQKMLEFSYKPR